MKLLLLLFLTQSSATLNHDSLPLVEVDEYEGCLRGRGDAYCFVAAKLNQDPESSLYRSLAEHSANKITHFDRTKVYRGICLNKSCEGYSSNRTVNVVACINATLSRDHGLTATVLKRFCTDYQKQQFDVSDHAFGVVVVALLAFNVLGSIYELCGGGENSLAGKFLVCFAVRRNWRSLVSPASQAPAQKRLQCLSAYRVFLSLGVIFAHTPIPFTIMIQNKEYPERIMKDVDTQIIFNSTHYVQVFNMMSALLLAFNVLLAEKKMTLGWQALLKTMFLRWLRLTPVYALVLFFISSWLRHIGEGPFWKVTVDAEATDCRRYWWLHLLYIQNYFNSSRCMPHCWYMPVEMQLTAVGLAIFFLLRSTARRMAAIAVAMSFGVLSPAATTFLHNLDPVLITTPEKALNVFVDDPTFNKLYRRGHTNIMLYAIGLALGCVVYHLKKSDLGGQKYKKYRALHWALFPMSLVVCWTGVLFYEDEAEKPSLHIRAGYASAVKACLGLQFCTHIFLTIVKADNLIAKIFNWHGWTVLSRLTFCVYLIHMAVLSIFAGNQTSMLHASIFGLCFVYTVVASTCFLVALPLFLLAEAPCAQLVKLCLAPPKKRAD